MEGPNPDLESAANVEESAPSLHVADHIAFIRLNRPARRNSLNNSDIAEFAAHLDRVNADPAVRVLVLTATGPTFCSGYDLRNLRHEAAETEGTPGFDRLSNALEAARVPTIAALSGGLYGGGTELALACDFRIGIPGIEFRMSAARIGVHYYHSGLARFVRALGLSAAKRLFLLAEPIGTEEMLRVGVLHEVVAPSELQARVAALAQILCGNSPAAVQGMKRALNGIAAGEDCEAETDRAWIASLGSADVAERLAAFAQRRRPDSAAESPERAHPRSGEPDGLDPATTGAGSVNGVASRHFKQPQPDGHVPNAGDIRQFRERN